MRNLSESNLVAIKTGRSSLLDILPNAYNCGYHVSWNNKKFYFRSGYELRYMLDLDKNKVDYEFEKIRIKYFDSNLDKWRIAVPDFYLPNNNMIVEVKSIYTFNKENMIDRFDEYKKHNYNVLLQLENKFYTYDELKTLNIITIKSERFIIPKYLDDKTIILNKRGRPRKRSITSE